MSRLQDFLDPEPSPLDIRFRLFGTDVRVSPGFWVLHGVIGLVLAVKLGLLYGAFWVGGVFVSVLVHEFGHVAAGRVFGARGEIVLTALGGLARGSSDLHDRRQRIAVYLAGPLVQFLLGVALWLLYQHTVHAALLEALQSDTPEDYDADRIMALVFPPWLPLVWLNLAWPVCNLLPIPPLDGGLVAQEIIRGWRGTPPWEQDPEWWKRG